MRKTDFSTMFFYQAFDEIHTPRSQYLKGRPVNHTRGLRRQLLLLPATTPPVPTLVLPSYNETTRSNADFILLSRRSDQLNCFLLRKSCTKMLVKRPGSAHRVVPYWQSVQCCTTWGSQHPKGHNIICSPFLSH